MIFRDDDGRLNKKIVIPILVIILVLVITVICIFANNKERVGVSFDVQRAQYEYFIVSGEDGKVGVVNRKGEKVIPQEYAYIFIPNQTKSVFFCFEDENKYKVLNSYQEDLFTDYENVSYITISDTTMEMEKEVLSYEKDGKLGLIDLDGTVLTDAIYDSITSLANKPGFLLVKKEGNSGVLDSLGNVIIDPIYNSIKGDEYSSEIDGYKKTGYIISEKTDSGILYGYMDYTGKMLIKPTYESIQRVLEYEDDDTYLVFRENGKKGVIKNKKEIIKAKYQEIVYNNESDVFVVSRSNKYGFFDNDGDEILGTKYTSYTIAGNYISVKIDENMFLYDLHGNLVNTNHYKSVIGTGNSSFFITINDDGYYSIISKDVQIDEHYKDISYAFDNFFIYANEEGRYGVLNVYTGIEVEPAYDFIVALENGKVLQAVNGTTVDIYSENIEKIVSMENGKLEIIDNNYAVIYSDFDKMYLDNVGKIVENTEVFPDKEIYSFKNDEGKWGYKNKNGETIVECTYDFATEVNEYGYASVSKDNKWGVIDSYGKVVVEPTYELETYYSPKFIGKYLLEENESVYCRVLDGEGSIQDIKKK